MEMDFLLLFHMTSEDSDEVVTGKFFEYVSSKKPIICLSPENMEARRIIMEMGIGMSADINSPDEIRKVLRELPNRVNARYYDGVDVASFGRSQQNEKMIAFLD